VYFDTSFRPAEAVSVEGPGAVVPKVESPPDVTVIETGELVVEAPWLSVTRRTELYVPGFVKVNDGFATVASPKLPSPFSSHEYEIVSPASGSEEPDPSKLTVKGAFPLVGVAVATAVGGWLAAPAYVISWMVPVFRSA